MQTVLSEGSGDVPVPRQARGPEGGDGRAGPPPGQPSPFECVLSGMVGARLVQEAICAFLRLTVESLSAQVVLLGLPMPSDRAMRKPCGRRPWTVAEVRNLISLWCANLHVDIISRELDRSAGGVRSKAERIGLYRRRRQDLIKTMDYLRAVYGTSDAASPEAATPTIEDDEPAGDPTPQSTGDKVKGALSRIAWNDDLGRLVARRWFAGQDRFGIARDLGMRETQVRSRANALGLPPRGRKTIPDYIEGRPYDKTLEESRVKRRCIQGNIDFWGTRHGPRTSPKIMKTKGYKKLRSGPEEHHAHI